jgi:hypothetical protein
VSSSGAGQQTQTLLNMLFGYALRHDAIARNPVEGTSRLRRPYDAQALTIDQSTAIRRAARELAHRRGHASPQPDGQLRDIIENLLGTPSRRQAPVATGQRHERTLRRLAVCLEMTRSS